MSDVSQNLNTKFTATDGVSPAIKRIGASVEVLNTGLAKLDRIGQLVGLTAGIGSVAAIGIGIVQAVSKANSAYENYEQQQVKLITIMHQRMGANADMVASVNEVIAAQTKLGIIGGSVQAAGAQQLATFVTNANALRTLIPVMDDLVVQQRGYNATTEDMVGIANMFGKVFTGQAAALRRVGISFSDEQEKLLKTLPEQERAALLAKIITENVGKMNEALAKTPEGQKVQAINKLNAELANLGKKLSGVKNNVLAEFAKTQLSALKTVGGGIAIVFAGISQGIIKTIQVVEGIGGGIAMLVSDFAPLIAIVGAGAIVYYGLTTAMAAYQGIAASCAAIQATLTTLDAIATGVTAAKSMAMFTAATIINVLRGRIALATAAQWALNIAMHANPISIVIAIVTVAIGVMAALAIRTYGLREVFATTWEKIVNIIQVSVNVMIGAINMFISAMNRAAVLGSKIFHWDIKPVELIKKIDLSSIRDNGAESIRKGTVIQDLTKYLMPEIPIGKDSAINKIGDTANSIEDNTDKIAKSTGRIADKIDMTDEEMKELRDVAQKGVISNYQHQQIIIHVHNDNKINSNVDIDGMTSSMTQGLVNALQEAVNTNKKGISMSRVVST